jgi:hypothetical protein
MTWVFIDIIPIILEFPNNVCQGFMQSQPELSLLILTSTSVFYKILLKLGLTAMI